MNHDLKELYEEIINLRADLRRIFGDNVCVGGKWIRECDVTTNPKGSFTTNPEPEVHVQ